MLASFADIMSGFLGSAGETGTITPGASADLAIWNAQTPAELVNPIGFNPLHARFWSGQ